MPGICSSYKFMVIIYVHSYMHPFEMLSLLINYTLLGSCSSGSTAKLSMLLERGPRGGGCLGGSLCLFTEISGFSSARHGFHVSPEMAARR